VSATDAGRVMVAFGGSVFEKETFSQT